VSSIIKGNKTTQVLALCRYADVKPRLFQSLLQNFGTLERVFKADSGKLMAIEGMVADTANKISQSTKFLDQAEEYYQSLKDRDISVITRFDDEYPNLLNELNDPPPLLYIRGNIPIRNAKTVALTGADEVSQNGIELTIEVSRQFAAADVQIISSLNKGIDTTSHIGSKAVDGISFSVLESGFDDIHPSENMPLAIDIIDGGGLISEYPPEAGFHEDNYKSSNRLIAGMARAVVITEAYKDSYRTLDLLTCCNQIGKLTFFIIDPEFGALADEDSLRLAVSNGAIVMVGLDKVDDIIKSLV